jgi:hypothetical protein
MLRITADLFSGRENPARIVSDEAEARATLAEVTRARDLLAEAPPTDAALGLRGFWIEPLSDELAVDFGIGASMYLAAGPQARDSRANEVAQLLISRMETTEVTPELAQEVMPLEAPLRELLGAQLQPASRLTVADEGPTAAAEAEAEAAAAVTCRYEVGAYNPGFWNNDSSIRSRNNCYNYASNKRTDTFAQPGRGCGHMYTAISCPEVTRGALCDGLHHRFNCFPDTERPRYLVALVVAPGPGFIDFHWYRKNREGFWSHKPGGTAVRNVDNRGRVITDPQTCDRGPYTQFCGYFYTCRTQKIR